MVKIQKDKKKRIVKYKERRDTVLKLEINVIIYLKFGRIYGQINENT